jgi:hypothetical protein
MTPEQKARAIQMLPTLTKIDAFSAAIAYQRKYEEHIDWHEFSNLFDRLNSQGILRVVSGGGMTEYALVRK